MSLSRVLKLPIKSMVTQPIISNLILPLFYSSRMQLQLVKQSRFLTHLQHSKILPLFQIRWTQFYLMQLLTLQATIISLQF